MLEKKKIWILEDDNGVVFMLEQILAIYYDLRFFPKISLLAEELAEVEKDENLPNLLICDLKLEDGYLTDYLCDNIFNCPFIIFSSIEDQQAMKICYQNGALDYILKPLRKDEILSKLENVFNRIHRSSLFVMGPMDIPPHVLDKLAKNLVGLTAKEQQIVNCFTKENNYRISKEELLLKVWKNTAVSNKALDVHLSNLRKKIKQINLNLISVGNGVWALGLIGRSIV